MKKSGNIKLKINNNKNILINCGIIICIILVCCSCSNKTEEKSDNNIKYSPITTNDGSINYGLLDEQGVIETQDVFYIESDEIFEKYINIENNVSSKNEYKIILFDNYWQSEFHVGEKQSTEYVVDIEKHHEKQIPIKLTSLSKGYHDIIIAIIRDPNKTLTDAEREENERNHMMFIRFNVIVDNITKTDYEITRFKINEEKPNYEILIHDNNFEKLTTIETDKKLDLELSVGNIYGEEQEYAVIFLQEFKQVRLFEDKKVLCTKLNENEQCSIPLQLDFKEEGYHDIVGILVESPYQKYDISNAITSSMRVGVLYIK